MQYQKSHIFWLTLSNAHATAKCLAYEVCKVERSKHSISSSSIFSSVYLPTREQRLLFRRATFKKTRCSTTPNTLSLKIDPSIAHQQRSIRQNTSSLPSLTMDGGCGPVPQKLPSQRIMSLLKAAMAFDGRLLHQLNATHTHTHRVLENSFKKSHFYNIGSEAK